MRHRFFLPLLAGLAALVTGCADPVIFAEVFQQQEGQKLYTRYNLWYTDPGSISSLNIQEGSRLPIGTEIIPVGTDEWDSTITFRDTAGNEYTIQFDPGYRLCSMRDFIAYTFTTEPVDQLLAEVPEKNRERIRRGEAVPGMNREEVIFAYGPPPSCRTPHLRNESWLYWVTPTQTVRVVFRGDIIRNIVNINKQR